MLNLMSMQAELIGLENQLHSIIEENQIAEDTNIKLLDQDFSLLRETKGTINDDQLEKLLEVRRKLDEYSIFILWSSIGSLSAC